MVLDKSRGEGERERTKSVLVWLMTAGWAAPGIDFLSPGYFQLLRCVWKCCCFNNSSSSRVWGPGPLNWICWAGGQGSLCPWRCPACGDTLLPAPGAQGAPVTLWVPWVVPVLVALNCSHSGMGLEGARICLGTHVSLCCCCPSTHPSTGARVFGSHGVIY